ncbi:MAG: hypothetical protein ACP5O4_05080 [bacterium]|jgi:predicted nucleotidyltransferase
MDNTIKLIKKIIEEELTKQNLKLINIILFGSRARGDNNENRNHNLHITLDKDLIFQNLKK